MREIRDASCHAVLGAVREVQQLDDRVRDDDRSDRQEPDDDREAAPLAELEQVGPDEGGSG